MKSLRVSFFIILTIFIGGIIFYLGIITGKESCNKWEYQIRLEPERAYLYDGDRLVGSVPYSDKDGGLDSLILMDNL